MPPPILYPSNQWIQSDIVCFTVFIFFYKFFLLMLNGMSVFLLFLFLKRMNRTADNTHILHTEWGYSACIAPDAWLGIHAESFVHTTWHGVIIYLCLCRCSCRTVAYISYVNGMHGCVCATACLLLVGTNLGNPPQLLSRVLPLSPCCIDLGVCMCYFATTIAILDSDSSGHVSSVCVCVCVSYESFSARVNTTG